MSTRYDNIIQNSNLHSHKKIFKYLKIVNQLELISIHRFGGGGGGGGGGGRFGGGGGGGGGRFGGGGGGRSRY